MITLRLHFFLARRRLSLVDFRVFSLEFVHRRTTLGKCAKLRQKQSDIGQLHKKSNNVWLLRKIRREPAVIMNASLTGLYEKGLKMTGLLLTCIIRNAYRNLSILMKYIRLQFILF